MGFAFLRGDVAGGVPLTEYGRYALAFAGAEKRVTAFRLKQKKAVSVFYGKAAIIFLPEALYGIFKNWFYGKKRK